MSDEQKVDMLLSDGPRTGTWVRGEHGTWWKVGSVATEDERRAFWEYCQSLGFDVTTAPPSRP